MLSPTLTLCASAQSWLTIAWSCGQARQRLPASLAPTRATARRATVAGSTPVTPRLLVVAEELAGREPDRRDAADAVDLARASSTTPFGSGEKPSWWVTMPAAVTCLSIALVDRRAEAGGEDRHEHDEREADHQRRGGDRGALRLAERVLAREHGRCRPWRASGAPSTRASGRTSSGASNAKPNIISTAPKPEQRARWRWRCRDRRTAPYSRIARPTSSTAAATTIRRLRRRPAPGVAAVAHRRRPARRASRGAPGTKPETIVAITPTSRPAMIVPRDHRMPVVPRSMPNALSSAASAGASSEAEQRCRGSTRTRPIDERLDQHRAQHLPARGAEHAQQRELLRALRDGDRERVEDQEAADQQRDAGEHEQRRADEAERVGEVLRLLLGLPPCRCGR